MPFAERRDENKGREGEKWAGEGRRVGVRCKRSQMRIEGKGRGRVNNDKVKQHR